MPISHEITLDVPRKVIQDDPRWCWAAAMESWLDAVGKPATSQSELFLMAAEKGYVYDQNTLAMNGLLKKAIPWLAKKVGMQLALIPKAKKDQFTLSYLYKKMQARGHVFLVYHPVTAAEDMAHAAVLYAISVEEGWMGLMDPWYGQGYRWPEFADIKNGSNDFIVGWR